ncbi:MAG: hypothetical protein KKA84_01425 [Bacteroidetes bacterium]|nr:hypothetical protein [Bacteroidota bacterium]
MKTLIVFFTICLISLTISASGKKIGKILTADEANDLFGSVTESVSIDRETLVSYLEECDKYMMCAIKDGQLIITDDNRKVLTPFKLEIASLKSSVPNNYIISDDEVLNVYSKSVVEELLKKANESELGFDMRGDVMTVSYGDYVMEFTSPCPPWCS